MKNGKKAAIEGAVKKKALTVKNGKKYKDKRLNTRVENYSKDNKDVQEG